VNRKTFGVAVIGCGLIGKKRIGALPSNCRLIGAYDTNSQAAQSAIDMAGTGVIFNSVNELLDSPAVEIVIVATAHSGLAESALTAARRGKHVLIEKPGARTEVELDAVRKEAARSGVCVRVGYNHRFHPSIIMAHDLINSGKYGELLWLRARYGHGGRVGYDKEWRAVREISGGGELLDQGSHLIDLSQFFFGPLSLVHAHLTTAFWNMEVEDNAFIHLSTSTGRPAWLHASWTEWKNTFSLEITLRTAKIEISGLGGSYGMESLVLYEMQPEMGPPPHMTWSWEEGDTSWQSEMMDFLSGIEGGKTMGATVDNAVATLAIIGKAYSK
jgi:predicted dehydrogenase